MPYWDWTQLGEEEESEPAEPPAAAAQPPTLAVEGSVDSVPATLADTAEPETEEPRGAKNLWAMDFLRDAVRSGGVACLGSAYICQNSSIGAAI